jgi:hypothetical protein
MNTSTVIDKDLLKKNKKVQQQNDNLVNDLNFK